MTSSKTSKLLKSYEDLPNFRYLEYKVFKLKTAIESSWYYSLLPSLVKSYIVDSYNLIIDLNKSYHIVSEDFTRAHVDLQTYKHNSLYQKAKNKQYSKLRHNEYVRNTKEGLINGRE